MVLVVCSYIVCKSTYTSGLQEVEKVKKNANYSSKRYDSIIASYYTISQQGKKFK